MTRKHQIIIPLNCHVNSTISRSLLEDCNQLSEFDKGTTVYSEINLVRCRIRRPHFLPQFVRNPSECRVYFSARVVDSVAISAKLQAGYFPAAKPENHDK